MTFIYIDEDAKSLNDGGFATMGPPKGLAWKPLRVHVIGAGVMGADIAGFCVASEIGRAHV